MTTRGRRLGAYETVRLLGAGGMGEVYLARHRHLGRTAAIKLLLPEVSVVPEAVTRFLAEARAAALVDHPSIVQVFDCDILDDGRAYIVMEYLRGESLRATIERQGSLAASPRLAAAILAQAADACAAAHAKGIVHRDLKPDNLFLATTTAPNRIQIKVLDFGIAKLLQTDKPESMRTRTGVLLGTPRYMSPEQCRGSVDVDLRADVYSLGCVLFELLSGAPPFDRQSLGDLLIAQATEPAPPMGSVAPGAPPALAGLVDRMLAKEPGKRPQSMHVVVSALCEFLGCSRDDLPQLLHPPDGFAPPPLEVSPSREPTPAAIASTVAVPTPVSAEPAVVSGDSLAASGLTSSLPGKLGTTFGTSASEIFDRTQPLTSTRKRSLLFGGAALGVLSVVGALALLARRPAPVDRATEPVQAPTVPTAPAVTEARAAPAEPETVRVLIESRPAGAQVWLDGEPSSRGATPLSLELPRGSTPLRGQLRAPGHLALTFDLPVARDGRLSFELVQQAAVAPKPAPRKRPAAASDPFRPVGD